MSRFGSHQLDCHDFRSPSVKRKRNNTYKSKYNNFGHTKSGQMNTPHYVEPAGPHSAGSGWNWPADLSSCAIVPGLSKRELYQEAQTAAEFENWTRFSRKCFIRWGRGSHDKSGSKSAKREAAGYLKDGGFKGRCRDGFMDTRWDCPELLDRYPDCFDSCCDWCYWRPHPDEQVIPGPAVDFGELVDAAMETRAKRMKRTLDADGWVEVEEQDDWSEVDSDDIASMVGLSE
jgi:hypothetical protein